MAAPACLCLADVSTSDIVGICMLVAAYAAWRTADLFLSRDIRHTLWQRRWLLGLGVALVLAGGLTIAWPRLMR